MSPATSIVKSPEDKSISVPSIVMLSTVSPPSKPADVPPIACEKVTAPFDAIVMASASLETPIVPPSLITRSSAIVSNPAELSDIFSAAASDAPVKKLNLVALLEELKSPSDTACIPAATKIASVPAPSSGAWNSILPITSSAAISVSPVCSVSITGLSSAVAVCFNISPLSALWINLTSLSAPNKISELSVPSSKLWFAINVPASEPSIVKKVVSAPPSVPLSIISESFACASIVIFPELVVIVTAASPAVISSAAEEPPPPPAAQDGIPEDKVNTWSSSPLANLT